MDILSSDAVTHTKLNALFDYYKGVLDATEVSANSLLSRYSAVLSARTDLLTRKTSLEALYASIVSASSATLPDLSPQTTTNNTNNTNLTSTEGSVNSLTTRINAVIPGTTHIAYNTNWAASRFTSFTATAGSCVGTNASGNWVATTAPLSNGYPELANVEQIVNGNGGSLTTNTWTTRPFTNLTRTGSSWIALDSGDISLYPGFYVLRYAGVTNGVDGAQTRIINRATSAILRRGVSVNGVAGTTDDSSYNTVHRLFAILVLTAPTIIQFQVRANAVNTFNSAFTLGRAMSGVTTNVYQSLGIMRMEGR